MTLHQHLNIDLLKMADVIHVEIPFLRICSPQGSVSSPSRISLEFPSWESWRVPFGLCPWGCTVVPEGVVSPWAGWGTILGRLSERPILETPWNGRCSRLMCPSLFSCCTANMPEDYPDQFDDVMDFIQATIRRLKRSPEKQMAVLPRRERHRQGAATSPESARGKGRRGQRGRNRGCVLTAVHLNVTDLGLGYETKEELIFRYCSGSCDAAETMYDKILKNLSKSRRLVSDKVGQACCRPIAFDDDLSFLDDNLVYHILRKHSAKRCGCIWLRLQRPLCIAFLLQCKERDQGSQKMFAQSGRWGPRRQRRRKWRQRRRKAAIVGAWWREIQLQKTGQEREKRQPSAFSRMAADVTGSSGPVSLVGCCHRFIWYSPPPWVPGAVADALETKPVYLLWFAFTCLETPGKRSSWCHSLSLFYCWKQERFIFLSLSGDIPRKGGGEKKNQRSRRDSNLCSGRFRPEVYSNQHFGERWVIDFEHGVWGGKKLARNQKGCPHD